MKLEIFPVEGLPEVQPGDDLAALLAVPLLRLGVQDGDVIAVTQKIVSKAEGRLVPDRDREQWIEEETRRVVARRDDLVIVETHHGLVCANAGVDASNVGPGMLALLPKDPDASARLIKEALSERLGVQNIGVVITDTFGRPWRQGVLNVAIGCAGMPAVVDLRGQADHTGRPLDVTIVALADEVAAATGLVSAKASRVPASVVRGVSFQGAPTGAAADLIRPPEEDLFRESPLRSVASARPARTFDAGDVPRGVIEEAVRIACATGWTAEAVPWMFTALDTSASKRSLLGAITVDGKPHPTLESAAVLIVPWSSAEGMGSDTEVSEAEQRAALLARGATIQSLLLALHAQGVASCWLDATLARQTQTRAIFGVDERWFALGIVAAGRMRDGELDPPLDMAALGDVLAWR